MPPTAQTAAERLRTAGAQTASGGVVAAPVDVGFASSRVRQSASPERLYQTIGQVLADGVGVFRAIEGYRGFIYATDLIDVARGHTLALYNNAMAGAFGLERGQRVLGSLDPRLASTVVDGGDGVTRLAYFTTRGAATLPPSLTGCYLSQRIKRTPRTNDPNALVELVTAKELPLLAVLDGFIAYLWMQTGEGRIAITIWETYDQMRVGATVSEAWIAKNELAQPIDETIVHEAEITYADLPFLV